MSIKRNLGIILLAVGVGLSGCSKNPVSSKLDDTQVELSPYDLSLLRHVGGPDDVSEIELHGYPEDNYQPNRDVMNLVNIVKTNAKNPRWDDNEGTHYSITINDNWEVNYFETQDTMSSFLMIKDLYQDPNKRILIPLFDYNLNGTLNPIWQRIGNTFVHPRLPNKDKNKAYLNLVNYLTQAYEGCKN